MKPMLKYTLAVIGILYAFFAFGLWRINFNPIIGILIVVGILAFASINTKESAENESEKEDMPITVKRISATPQYTQSSKNLNIARVTNPSIVNANIVQNNLPTKDIFVSNSKVQIEKVIKKHLQGTVIWTTAATEGLSSRTDFTEFVQVGKKKVRMYVSMNNNGPTQITFPTGKYAPIFLDKNLKKEHKPEISTPKEPKAPKEPKKLTNAEKKGNVIFNEEGKPEVKPNYKMIASDWINQNLEYLNKACNDAMIAGGNVVEALLAKDKLPADQEAWEAIGAMLKDQEEIDFYEITENGIVVTIE